MIMSLAVLLVPIALIMIFYRVVLDGDKPVTVDPSSAIQQASKEFTVAQPAGLSDDWHVSSAIFRRADGGATLRLGYVDPADKPILLVQSTTDAAALVKAEVSEAPTRTGTFRTDRRTWMVYDGRPGETAMIATERSHTIVILGQDGDTKNLEQLASSLS
ncbi:hypothetical protein MB27_40570 [Actinoplanes utahensis]|uniref:DUF4245 domain-containing protein n=2 Tax=Actinoplanes utahensis TaxID=1869 RepID=A0A0A6UCA8_ACTUT|nr:hypothetical protein MB27_40570 [Actinoplanes utahensis]